MYKYNINNKHVNLFKSNLKIFEIKYLVVKKSISNTEKGKKNLNKSSVDKWRKKIKKTIKSRK